MRTLKFIVDKQIITPDPSCNFDGLIPGTVGYLQAEFSFSREWRDCTKVVAFWSPFGREYPPQVLEDGRTCLIPTEALAKQSFKIQVIGQREDYKLVTNKLLIKQNGGRL